MTDEDVIRSRLLIDGDGTGDDRRLNIILKTFHKLCNQKIDSPAESQAMLDRINSQLTLCEYAFIKSRLVARGNSSEFENYENLIKEISEHTEAAKQEIEKKKEDFKEAKTIRKNRTEYEVLANIINEQPDRKQTFEKLSQLKKELNSLEEKSQKLDEQMGLRRKQFHVLIASIHQLEALSESKEGQSIDTLDGFDDEDMDILNGEKTDTNKMEIS